MTDLYKLWQDSEYARSQNMDLVMIASLSDCEAEAEARSRRDRYGYDVKDDTGLLVSRWLNGACTWRLTPEVNDDNARDR